jgi:hypothetical protein
MQEHASAGYVAVMRLKAGKERRNTVVITDLRSYICKSIFIIYIKVRNIRSFMNNNL